MAQGSYRRLARAWVGGGRGPAVAAVATALVALACAVGGGSAWAAAGAGVVACAWEWGARRGSDAVARLGACRDARVAEAMDGAREGFLVVDAAGLVVVANEGMADLVGVPPSRLAPGRPVAVARDGLAVAGRRAAATLLDAPMGRRQSLETDVGDGRWVAVGRTATRDGGYAVVARDVSAAHSELARLREARAALSEAIDGMGQGLCLFDADGRLRFANPRFVELFGLDARCVAPGIGHADVVQAMVAAGHYPNQSGEDVVRFEAERSRPGAGGGTSREISGGRTVCVRRSHLPGGGWVATYEDATERVRSLTRMSHMASHDALTGLANRTRLLDQVTEHAARASSGKAFALHYLDLDHFKPINDRLGHPCGDELLRQVATRLKACLRDRDTVARLGGDEFAIIQTGVSQPADAQVVADRIVREMARPFTLEGNVVRIGVSIGVTIAPTDGVDAERLLKNADMALLKAKGEGRGAWRFFETAMDETVQNKRMIETELRDGIGRDEFEVHYQPIVDLATSRVVALEALVRWRHPVRGMVPPAEFIQVAEDVGAIRELGTFVVERACREVARRRDGLRVAVNVSAVQLRDPGFVDVLRGALAASGLEPGRLELEITEGVLSGRGADVLGLLEEIGSMGVRLSLDDFGTGYSSLGYLRKYPFDRIKVDRSLLGEVGRGGGGAAEQAVRAAIQMGRSLGISVTAEGVETEAQRAWLGAEGCHEAQGYLFARPVPMAEVDALVGGPLAVALAA